MKSIIIKKTGKQHRERKVLLGLVEFYLKTGKPVGSNTLKEAGFDDLSSATIRNYFSKLETEGYLTQQHTSGGRIPTPLAFRIYAQEYLDSTSINDEEDSQMLELRNADTKEIAAYLQKAAEKLSSMTNNAVFLSAPRFDQDFVVQLKMVAIDHNRCLCIMITDFGVIQTEVLQLKKKLSAFVIKRIESYFEWRLTGYNKPENLEPEEENLAQNLYNELMVRYIVGYSGFTDEEIYRTGFSKLLKINDFQDITVLANSLALFENAHSIRLLLKECMKLNTLKFWIGDDLISYSTGTPNCAVVAIPYHINKQIVGAIGLLGPIRLPYKQVFGVMRSFADSISEALTRNIYKFKITFRRPEKAEFFFKKEEQRLIGQSRLMLLEHIPAGIPQSH